MRPLGTVLMIGGLVLGIGVGVAIIGALIARRAQSKWLGLGKSRGS